MKYPPCFDCSTDTPSLREILSISRGIAKTSQTPTHTLTVSSFAFLECFALTKDTVGFLGGWIEMRAVAAVSSVATADVRKRKFKFHRGPCGPHGSVCQQEYGAPVFLHKAALQLFYHKAHIQV
jgi:hypothetical protein